MEAVFKTLLASWDRNYRHATGPLLTQQIMTDAGLFELSCRFLEPSFSDFPETVRYWHFAPLISRLILVKQGSVLLEFPGKHSVRIKEGEIYLLPSNHPFYATYCDHCITNGFHLYLHDHMGLILGKELPEVSIVQCPELIHYLRFGIDENSSSLIHLAIMGIVVKMLQEQLSLLRKQQDIPPLCRKVIDRIRKNPSMEYSLTEVAEEMRVSLVALSNLFRRHMGYSLQSYRARLLLDRARLLLEVTNLTVGEIAGELGFSDVNYFFVFFKKAMKITPLAYRLKSHEKPHQS